VGLVAFFVLLLAAAIAGGLLVGARVRPTTAQTGSPQQPAASPSQAPSASAAPTAETLTIPTIEMK
jgi:hypothetical protein